MEILMRAANLAVGATGAIWFVAIAWNFGSIIALEDTVTYVQRQQKMRFWAWYSRFVALRVAGMLITGTAAGYGLMAGLGG